MGIAVLPQQSLKDRAEVREDGCWHWTGPVSTSGYSRITYRGLNLYGHRISYEMYRGPIPEGLVIDHLCRNRLCVNPGHLEVVTDRTNILRGIAPSAKVARTQRCQRGHDLTDPANIQPRGNGHRMCRACQTLRNAARYRPVPELAADFDSGEPEIV